MEIRHDYTVMPLFTQDSLDRLRQRIDLVDALSPYVELKRAGAAYKGLCPFHDEKSPSFTIQKGDTHYHCFGCGAHGDAVRFFMAHLQMNFHDAVESLAEKFQVHLDKIEGKEEYKGPSKSAMKEALEAASLFFHFCLLHTPEGQEALQYLYKRGIPLAFIQQFMIGWAPSNPGFMRKSLHEKRFSDEVLLGSGLLSQSESGRQREFFSERITIPIHNSQGSVIGFTARKIKEEVFGGKYVNTSETPLFKKSRILFGLHHSRRRIIKERKVIIVEGQLDALRLIYSGLNFTVAGQGTAFGEGHVDELMAMGITVAYLALDPDGAGREAAVKVGDLFQKRGAEVKIVSLPRGLDPDAFIISHGPEEFSRLMEKSQDYLEFLVSHLSRSYNLKTPAGKTALVQQVSKQIRGWEHPVMVHESLKKLAHLTQMPEEMLGIGQMHLANIHIRKTASVGFETIDPVRILELDFVRWLVFEGLRRPDFIESGQKNITPEDLHDPACRRIYKKFISRYQEKRSCELLSLLTEAEDQELIEALMSKKVDHDRAEKSFYETVQRILDRNWLERREEVKRKIHSGMCSDEEALLLLKQFEELKRGKPQVEKHAEASSVL